MPCVVRVIKSRRIWAEYIAHMGEVICVQNFGWKPEGRRAMQDIGVDGREILQ